MGVAGNYLKVRADMDAAARKAGREPSSVKLVAVSKTVAAERVIEAVRAGASILGENRVQEALSKMEEMAPLYTAAPPEWHLIGTLQKNKAKHAVGAFTLIHSVDGIELAREIDRQAARFGIVQDCLLEVNVAAEESKHGIRPEEALPIVREAASMKNIRLVGLMCIPPFTADAESSRPHFRTLRALRDEIDSAGFPMTELSMGMSQDYEAAVEEGATLVRVGTAIFGGR